MWAVRWRSCTVTRQVIGLQILKLPVAGVSMMTNSCYQTSLAAAYGSSPSGYLCCCFLISPATWTCGSVACWSCVASGICLCNRWSAVRRASSASAVSVGDLAASSVCFARCFSWRWSQAPCSCYSPSVFCWSRTRSSFCVRFERCCFHCGRLDQAAL